jgi:hypothetical protein
MRSGNPFDAKRSPNLCEQQVTPVRYRPALQFVTLDLNRIQRALHLVYPCFHPSQLGHLTYRALQEASISATQCHTNQFMKAPITPKGFLPVLRLVRLVLAPTNGPTRPNSFDNHQVHRCMPHMGTRVLYPIIHPLSLSRAILPATLPLQHQYRHRTLLHPSRAVHIIQLLKRASIHRDQMQTLTLLRLLCPIPAVSTIQYQHTCPTPQAIRPSAFQQTKTLINKSVCNRFA